MSDSLIWILWAVMGAILMVAEIFTTGFVLFWFGIGALAAAFVDLIGIHNLGIQFLVFAAVSIGLTAASRTIFLNYFTRDRQGELLRTGVHSLPGKIGTVVSSSRGAMNEGAVKVFGSTWTAYPAAGEPPLEAGERVCVESVEGASIYVRRVEEGRDWRQKSLPKGE